MDEYQEQRILQALEDIDRLVPSSNGRIKISGGWPETNRMEADRAGFVRLGLMLLHAGLDAGPHKRELDSDLFVSDSPIRFDELWVVERNRSVAQPVEPKDDGTKKAALMIITFTVGVIVAVTAVCSLVYFLMHVGHK